jgi:signal transduction histidine kinase
MHDEIWTLYDDGATLWAGTLGGGLEALDQRSGTFTHYTPERGLAGNIVSCILPDGHGRLWLATNAGVSRFDAATGRFTTYENTLIESVQPFSYGAGLSLRDGSLLFGGENGLLHFHPDSVRGQGSAPALMITSIRAGEREIAAEAADGAALTLPYRDNSVAFEFAALDFINPEQNTFAYMLEGADRGWVQAGTRRTVAYSALAPGTYRFLLRGANSDGVWNTNGIAITITITPPWYLTVWFRGLVALLVLAALAGAWYLRARSIRRTADVQRRVVESELKALRAQMNPHFLFNCLNAIQNIIFDSDSERANAYLTKFARLMRLTLEHSKRHSIPLSDEVAMLGLYLDLEDLRHDHCFEYAIHVDPALDDDTPIPSMLIQPYVENAIRHGLLHRKERGRVVVSLERVGDGVRCTIEDNGIGRARAMDLKRQSGRGHRSMGMEITRDRLDMLNEHRAGRMSMRVTDLADASGDASGTRVEIEIPLEA